MGSNKAGVVFYFNPYLDGQLKKLLGDNSAFLLKMRQLCSSIPMTSKISWELQIMNLDSKPE